ncbi:MAG TPA: hypothetical protein VJ826_15190 [Candidatus Polarisedimenticolaceae bacterium]|nr:hypothetical protein [Candidatus Polarisedimenticolaceae bacterium]
MPKKLSAARKGGVKLEESAGKPSRKSTRGGKGRTVTEGWNEEGIPSKRHGKGHVKAAATLTLTNTMKVRSPSSRAVRAKSPGRGGPPAR